MINEGFRDFFKNKTETPTSRPKAPRKLTHEEKHDEFTDQAMHHLNQLHKLTHPDSEWSKINKGRKRSSKHIEDLHSQVNELIKKHSERTNKTF